MNMYKLILSLFFVFIGFSSVNFVYGQTTRNVVVEHFTNTRCGICANRNPGLFTNLESSKEVMHLSIHPSRPYSNCVLNNHNTSENDARTNYYNIYGSTPRVVVQGEVKSVGEDFSSKSLFSSALNQTTPIELSLNTIKKGDDSLVVDVIVKTTEAHSLSDLNLFVVAAEDTVFYDAPNGEKQHYDVFRKVLLNQAITLSSTDGDSTIYRVSVANHSDWDASRMFAMAMVQNSNDKKIEQVESSKGDADVITVSTKNVTQKFSKIYPNPFKEVLTIQTNNADNYVVEIFDVTGTLIKTKTFQNSTAINTKSFTKGVYIFSISNGESVQVERLIKN